MLLDAFLILPNALLSGIIWFLALTVFLYFAREPAHRVILSFGRLFHSLMRLGAASVTRTEQALVERNREVLLATGREASERFVEREFERVEAAVHSELAECPTLHRRLREELAEIEEDYKRSSLLPPSPPGWVDAVEAVGKMPSKGDPMVANILESIHKSLVDAHASTIKEYRAANSARHRHLTRMLPHWRKLLQVLGQLDTNVGRLMERAKGIDRRMEEYEAIVGNTDQAVRSLSASSVIQFFISAFVLVIAVGGALINFHLIARPLSEMVGGTSAIGTFRTADVAALVIILVEISMGLFLMESFRITRLFPIIGALPDKLRVRMIWVTFGILLALASVEAGLAYMRDLLLRDELATNALLRGEGAAADFQSAFLWITTTAQMGMGFILPFALTFVAIPLGTFVQSARTVVGMLAVVFLRGLALFLRLLGNLTLSGSPLLIDLYDVVIFAPLWIERHIKGGRLGAHDRSDIATMKRAS
ncbi:MAG: hypothetical protein ACE5Q3_01585 [Alphaproteobacteria bacterium]